MYAFDGTTYKNYSETTNANGQVTFTLPQGSYRFRADYDGVQFWSGTANHCDIPGCSNAEITLPGSLVGTNVTIDYAYDGLYRLIRAYYARTGSPGDYQSGYDYEYDRVGNRIYEDA